MSYKDTIQNFQFCSVWAWTYSLNFCLMWSKRCRVMGTPVAGSCSWHALQGEMDGKKKHTEKEDFKTLSSINEWFELFHSSYTITDKTKVEVSLDGRVEELDLLPESLRLLMQLSSLLLHLADVLSRLLQRGGFTDLSQQTRGLQHVSDLPRWTFGHIYASQLRSRLSGSCCYTAARLHAVPWCLAESWASPQDYVACQIPVWCWNAASVLRRCEWSSWSLLAADDKKKKRSYVKDMPWSIAGRCKSNETASSTLFVSIFACPEKDACEDSGPDTFFVRLGGEVLPGCRGKGTKRIIVN